MLSPADMAATIIPHILFLNVYELSGQNVSLGIWKTDEQWKAPASN
jgi:hypothetical protein